MEQREPVDGQDGPPAGHYVQRDLEPMDADEGSDVGPRLPAKFVGIGIGHYQHHAELPAVECDIRGLQEILDDQVDAVCLIDPTEEEVYRQIRAVHKAVRDEPIIFMWAGHGFTHNGMLRVLAADSEAQIGAGIPMSELVLQLAASGTRQLLVIIDTCFAGAGALPALNEALSALGHRSPRRSGTWVGVLSSAWPDRVSFDGVFGSRLRTMLEKGPSNKVSQVLWSTTASHITGAQFGDAMTFEWDGPQSQLPLFIDGGNSWLLLRNPLYESDPSPAVTNQGRVVAEMVRNETMTEFIGRARETGIIGSWIDSGSAGLRIVTGSAGTGKSALVGHAVKVAAPDRAIAYTSVRGLTTDQMAARIDTALIGAGVLAADPGPVTSARLLARISAREAGSAPPVIVLDALNEAGLHAFAAVTELLLPLARHAVLVIATRDAEQVNGGSGLLAGLDPIGVIDLDDADSRADEHEALRTFVVERLAGVSSAMDVTMVADRIVAAASGLGAQLFLLARTITDQLRSEPVDTGTPDWSHRIHASLRAAFAADLAAVTAPTHRELPDGVPAVTLACHLLSALVWAFGTGFPEDEWVVAADATGPLGIRIDRRDIGWLLESFGRYVLQSSEGSRPTYRLANDVLADMLTPPSGGGNTVDPTDTRPGSVAVALLDRYRHLLDGGIGVREPIYLWRYAWRHAVAGGTVGMAALHRLAADTPQLRSHAGLAELTTAVELRERGLRSAAVPHAEHAVRIYRTLTDPARGESFALAGAVNNLAALYRDAGRPIDAAAANRDAVAIYRRLGAAASADLAGALSNSSIYLSASGMAAEAATAGIEAVELLRAEAGDHPADLAMALTNLSIALRECGRYADAHDAALEAVELYRQEEVGNPGSAAALGNALSNLSACMRELGHRTHARAVAAEAVGVSRAATATDRARRPLLAVALGNLSACQCDLGEREDAYRSARESAELYRSAADLDPIFRRHLAAAYARQGTRLRELGRIGEALAVADLAVSVGREIAGSLTDAGSPELADALGEYANCCYRVGDTASALAAMDEAVRRYRTSAAHDVPGFAAALNNLGTMRRSAGLRAEALAAARESVALYRSMADDHPRLRIAHADALANYGIIQHDLDSAADALATMEQAVGIYRRAARDSGGLASLAAALTNLAAFQVMAGQVDKAIQSAEESVERYRELVAEQPALQPQLAMALDGLGTIYHAAGRSAGALAVSAEAITLLGREPVDVPRRALARYNASIYQSALGRADEAGAVLGQAVADYEAFLSDRPEHVSTALPDLAQMLTDLASIAPEAAEAAWQRLLARHPERADEVDLHRSIAEG